MKRGVAAVVSLLAGAVLARAQTIEVPSFVAGGPTFGQHVGEVEVAPAPDGSFLVLWGDYDPGNGGVDSKDHATVRLMSSSGVPLGPPMKADTTGHVFAPRVSADGLGGFVASWQWIGGGEYLFFGQTFTAQGVPKGPDFEVTLNLAGYPVRGGAVIGSPLGPVFVWDENGAWARGLDADRSRRAGDVRVGESAYRNDIATLPDGGFVTTWVGSFGEAASMGRVFGPNGAPRGPGFAVSELFGVPRVAANPRGGFASVGIRFGDDGATLEAWARRFDDYGTPTGDEFWVHTAAAPDVYLNPDVEFDDRGNLYVVFGEWGNGAPPRARVWDSTGASLGPAVAIGTGTASDVRAGRLANGAIVNVWNGSGQARGSIVRICAAGTSVCGDGVRVAACEDCDDGAGNGSTPGGCRIDCRAARCGDGVTDPGEACDDGNAASCDGCSAACQIEPGTACGDGVRSQVCGEECDAGAANGSVPDGCRADCRLPRCGDGVLDSGEACDDGGSAACDGCDIECQVETVVPDVCAPQPIAGLTAAELARFDEGLDEFLSTENPATGLGPVFNGTRCAECHAVPTVGGASDRNVTRIGAGGGPFNELAGSGGPLLQTNGITTGTCSVSGEVVPPAATIVGQRNTPALFGAGLIEAIPDLSIRLMKAKQREPLSGRFNTNTASNRIGRFGWKAQIATIHDFAAEAYHDEMGITTPFLPAELAPQGVPTACDDAADYEDDGSDVAAFADFMTLLAPLAPPPPSLEARRGRRYFRRAKCHKCHTDKYRTARNFPIVALRNKKVPLFSDLLLHDMGPGLADGIVQDGATGSEFRTPPLWGLRFSAPYLHDGRAATLPEAIAAHGGEAQSSANVYFTYTAEQIALLVAYLDSL